MSSIPKVVLRAIGNTTISMPLIGYGTWQATDAQFENAINVALKTGYRLIDTAYVYENEKIIGKVLKNHFDSGLLKRDEIFVVSKLPPVGMTPEGVRKYLKKSLQNLQLSYLDLYLIHLPFGFKDYNLDVDQLYPTTSDGSIDFDPNTDHIAIWKEMEKQVDQGLTKAIGLSNFNPSQIERVIKNAHIPPSVLQIELHAYHQQNELVDLCKKNNIAVMAYSSLGNPGLGAFLNKFGKTIELPNLFENPIVKSIAEKKSKTPAQILLRHLIQKGICVIPKSVNPERVKQNFDLFDFDLSDEEMNQMNKLDHKHRLLDFLVFKGITQHPEYPFKE